MYVAFDEMPDESRIWIYQADRVLTSEEKEKIENKALEFIHRWTAHGASLKASFSVIRDRFLVLAVDRNFNEVSGCSIDASVHFIQDMERDLGVDFFNRSLIACLDDHGVQLIPLQEIKQRIKNGELSGDTLTFNNVIEYKEDMDKRWIIPAKESWIRRYF